MHLHSEKNTCKICHTGPPIFINYKRFTKKKKMKKQKKIDRRDIYMDIVRSLQYLKLKAGGLNQKQGNHKEVEILLEKYLILAIII